MECDEIRHFLPAYADNELSVEGALEVEHHLQACPDCRALLAQSQQFTDAVGHLYPRVPVPPGLQERVRHAIGHPAPSRYRMGALALAAGAVLMLALWPFWSRRQPTIPLAIVGAAQLHRNALIHELPLGVQSSNAAAVNGWLRHTLPFTIGEPVRATSGQLQLHGATQVHLAGEPVGYVRYTSGGDVISLLLLRPRSWPADGSHAVVRDMDFHFYSVDGLKLIAWNHAPLSYVLVSTLGSQGVGACTVCHSGAADAALQGFADQGLI